MVGMCRYGVLWSRELSCHIALTGHLVPARRRRLLVRRLATSRIGENGLLHDAAHTPEPLVRGRACPDPDGTGNRLLHHSGGALLAGYGLRGAARPLDHR